MYPKSWYIRYQSGEGTNMPSSLHKVAAAVNSQDVSHAIMASSVAYLS